MAYADFFEEIGILNVLPRIAGNTMIAHGFDKREIILCVLLIFNHQPHMIEMPSNQPSTNPHAQPFPSKQ